MFVFFFFLKNEISKRFYFYFGRKRNFYRVFRFLDHRRPGPNNNYTHIVNRSELRDTSMTTRLQFSSNIIRNKNFVNEKKKYFRIGNRTDRRETNAREHISSGDIRGEKRHYIPCISSRLCGMK